MTKQCGVGSQDCDQEKNKTIWVGSKDYDYMSEETLRRAAETAHSGTTVSAAEAATVKRTTALRPEAAIACESFLSEVRDFW